MKTLNSLYSLESWSKNHWLLLIIFFITIIFAIFIVILLIFLIRKKIKNAKIEKNIKKMWKNKDNAQKDISKSIIENISEFKLGPISIKKNNDNQKIAWLSFIEIVTRVIGNKFDEKYGDIKESISSIYKIYTVLREELKNSPNSYKSNIIILKFMNTELRPILTKWNFKIKNNKKLNKNEFIKDYNKMYENIINNQYLENLLLILGITIKLKDYTVEKTNI